MRVVDEDIRLREEAMARQTAEKNDLITYLAHDLKTPLASVIGYLSLLDESPDLPAPQRRKYVRVTLDRANRLEQLVEEFFDITRFNLHAIALTRHPAGPAAAAAPTGGTNSTRCSRPRASG